MTLAISLAQFESHTSHTPDKFHVYMPSALEANVNSTIEVPVCDDLKGLGNCYGKDYHCTITQDKLCHCE
jgi:hypothetical protein